MSELKQKTISGFFWSFIEKIGSRGINFVVIIILARILTPKDFGLIAMLTIFMELSQTLTRAGFGQALIQKKDTDDEDYSVVFWINLAVSFILYSILYFGAPLIAEFYKQPQLISLTRILSLIFVINAFSFVQDNRLQKDMHFKTLALIHIPAVITGGIVAIIMAKQNFGVWSLVFFQIIYRLGYSIQIWIYSKWKPLFSFKMERAKGLFSFGSKLMIASVLNTAFKNAYIVVIGKFFPVSTLGYYENAEKLERIPSRTLKTVLSNVTFSSFSSIKDDNERLKSNYRKVLQQIFFWVTPIFIMAAVMAQPLFQLILTEKWLPAVPFFQALCVVAIMYPLNAFNSEIMVVKGKSGLFLRLNIIKKLIIGIGIVVVVTLSLGIWYLVGFQIINEFIEYGINSYYGGRLIQYSMREQVSDVFPIVLTGILTGGIIFIITYIINFDSDFLKIVIGTFLGSFFYWLVSYVFHFKAYNDFRRIIKEQKRGFKDYRVNLF